MTFILDNHNIVIDKVINIVHYLQPVGVWIFIKKIYYFYVMCFFCIDNDFDGIDGVMIMVFLTIAVAWHYQ